MAPFGLVLAISVGAICGALGRFGFQNLLQGYKLKLFGNDLPLEIFLINAIGSFLIGVCAVVLYHRPEIPREMVIGITVGLLGSFTTFSTFSLEAYSLYAEQGTIGFLSYTVLHVGGCICLTILGMAAARLFTA